MLLDLTVMNPGHPRWREFCDRLGGPEGCDFRFEEAGDPSNAAWSCNEDRTNAAGVLADLGFNAGQVEASMAHFQRSGAHCDCEILFNLDGGGLDDAA